MKSSSYWAGWLLGLMIFSVIWTVLAFVIGHFARQVLDQQTTNVVGLGWLTLGGMLIVLATDVRKNREGKK